MSRIYWDTMLFVYWLEDHPRYAKCLRQVLRTIKERHDQLYTSSFALAEILVGRYKTGALKPHVTFARSFVRPPWK